MFTWGDYNRSPTRTPPSKGDSRVNAFVVRNKEEGWPRLNAEVHRQAPRQLRRHAVRGDFMYVFSGFWFHASALELRVEDSPPYGPSTAAWIWPISMITPISSLGIGVG